MKNRLALFSAFLAAAVSVFAACGGGGPCAQRSGMYRLNFKTRSGTCGNLGETLVNVAGQPTAPTPPCTGTISYSADNCEVTQDTTCPMAGDAGMMRMAGKATWSTDGKSGTAIGDISMNDGWSACQGTYDVTYTRL